MVEEQHGKVKALMQSLLQLAQRSLTGISLVIRELGSDDQ